MKKEKRRPETFKALMRRVTVLMLSLWLVVMGILTYAVAKDFYLQMEGQLYDYSNTRVSHGFAEDYPADTPGLMEATLIRTLGTPYSLLRTERLLPFVQPHTPQSWGSDDWIWGKWDLLYGYEAAVMYRDDEGRTVMTSGNYVSFAYTDARNWEAQNSEPLGIAYIDLDATEGCLDAFTRVIADTPYGANGLSLLVHAVRMTGYFEGNQFYPVTVDRGYKMPPPMTSEETPLSKLDAKGYIDWETIFTASRQPDRELVTVYGWDLYGIRSNYEPVTVNGVRFETLPELLEAHLDPKGYYETDSLWSAVIVSGGRKNVRTNGAEQEFVFYMAVRCWPMGYAMWRLLPTYLVSLAVMLFVLVLFRRRIRRSLTVPLENAITGVNQWLPTAPWHEPLAVAEKFQKYKDDLHAAETENQQLRTALDYAKNAEENRRQLVSNITHELKTPLAVIHSYAEGLRSGIAADKQDRYLSVILEESERMDAMVLQMLDLSRLEAGKVRLSTDQFSLLGLTERVLEKFGPAIEEKALALSFEMAVDFDLTADETRVTQVITNLVSNAVKYTDPGGRIRLWIYKTAGSARFVIENTASPLSAEAREKIFDSFYRADPSRSEPGTGLGLAIVKSIVELHRGSCLVSNKTYDQETCVQFAVHLPLN